MLTDLHFLDQGRPWPPSCEKERLKGYAQNRALFDNDHGTTFRDAFVRIERRIGDIGGSWAGTRYELCLSYPKRISVATANLLFSKPVGIVAGTETDQGAMETVDGIVTRSDLNEVLLTSALDVSRYGDGLLLVHRDEDTGEGVIDLSRPDVWFPVVDAKNVRRVLCHVLATPYRQAPVVGKDDKPDTLRVEIHERGYVTVQDYRLNGETLGGVITAGTRQKTGLSDFAVVPIHNLRTSERIHGIDDYDDIQALVCELDIRLSQIARVLDKHSAPSMQGPAEALTDSADGSRAFVPGGYFVNKEAGLDGSYAGEIKYLTWDAQMDANFKVCELLIEQIRVLSEMGALLSDLSDKQGQIPSGSAMRRLLTSALCKIGRLQQSYTPAIKRAVRLCSELGGKRLDDSVPLDIHWYDGLPGDPMEDAQVTNLRTAGKATMSRKRALMRMDGLTEESAEAEVDSILEDEAGELPPSGFGVGAPAAKDETEA